MVSLSGPPSAAIRNKPISAELENVLRAAGEAAGIDEIRITSGGQPAIGEGTRRTGSTRHDRGRAADLQLVVGGNTLKFTDAAADPKILEFVTAAAAQGANGIGAGVGYMGNKTIHVGFGTSVADHTKLTWGAGGRSATAPDWLRAAARAGWDAPEVSVGGAGAVGSGRYAVIARDGLRLRRGPGTNFQSPRTLPLGTQLDVLALEGDWALVDLEQDGLRDGYVFAAFLAAAGAANDEAGGEPENN
jgi:hypothetical protein